MIDLPFDIYLYLRYFPPYGDKFVNGLSKAVHGLATGLVECGATVTLVSEAEASETSVFRTKAGYTIRSFAQPTQNHPTFSLSSGLEEYVSTNLTTNSLVILNGMLHRSVFAFSRLCKKRNIPYVVASHDVYHPSMFSQKALMKFVYWHLVEKRLLQQAKAIQMLDSTQAKWLKTRGIQTPILVTPNGCLSTDVNAQSNLKWSHEGHIQLFYFGRLKIYHKGLDLLVEAFRHIIHNVDAQLIFQGPDSRGNKVQLQALTSDLIAEQKVRFLEPEYDKSASDMIAAYDIFCMPSRFEGFGASALEAMLSARPLLVSKESGIATHVRASQCGLVVKPDVEAICSGLLELCQRRSEWQEMGLRGQQYALETLN